MKTLARFSWRDAASLLFVLGTLPLLLLAAAWGELARRAEEIDAQDRSE